MSARMQALQRQAALDELKECAGYGMLMQRIGKRYTEDGATYDTADPTNPARIAELQGMRKALKWVIGLQAEMLDEAIHDTQNAKETV